MKRSTPNLLGAIIRDYFMDHLPRLRGSSPHTIHSYRDSLVLLLRFLSGQRGQAITQLDLTDIDPPGILAFLSYLEQERKNRVPTRNVRLSAIHAFFHFVAARNPGYLTQDGASTIYYPHSPRPEAHPAKRDDAQENIGHLKPSVFTRRCLRCATVWFAFPIRCLGLRPFLPSSRLNWLTLSYPTS